MRRAGGPGRPAGGRNDGISGTLDGPLTGFWFGDGGIDNPKRGVRAPPFARFPPGTGGRKSGVPEGAGEGFGDAMAAESVREERRYVQAPCTSVPFSAQRQRQVAPLAVLPYWILSCSLFRRARGCSIDR